MPDYTYLQAAQPTTAGHWLLSFAHPALRDAQRIAADFASDQPQPGRRGRGQRLALPARPRAARAPARVRRADRAHPRRDVADRRPDRGGLARRDRGHRTRAASPRTSRSTAATSSACCAIGDALCRASALMPQKRNPYALVVIRGAAGTLLGRATGVLATQRTPVRAHGQPALRLRRGRAARSTSPPRVARPRRRRHGEPAHRPRGLRARARRELRAWPPTSPRSCASSTASTTARRTASSAAPCRDDDLTADGLRRAARDLLDRDLDIAPERLAEALDPERALATRTVTGGAAPAPMDAMLDAAPRDGRRRPRRACDQRRAAARGRRAALLEQAQVGVG